MKDDLKNKRKKKTRKKAPKTSFGRKLKKVTFYFGLLSIIVFIGVLLSLTVLFKIDTVEVAGDTRYDKNDIASECTIKKGENLLLADAKSCKEKIEKEFPYIEEVSIDKRIPSKIIVNVKEAAVSGVIELDDNMYAVVSDKAKVLDIVESPLDGYAIIKGTNIKTANKSEYLSLADDHLRYAFQDLMEVLKKYDFHNITEIDLINFLNISITYEDRVKILLGSDDSLDYKLQTANEIIKNKLNSTERGVLDLSVVSEDGHSYFMPEYVS